MKTIKSNETLNYIMGVVVIDFGTKVKIGSKIYSFVGSVADVSMESVRFLDGTTTMSPVNIPLYTFKDDKGNYKTFSSRVEGNNKAVIVG